MTQVPPDAALLAACIAYLEGELLPALAGEQRFKTRLAINALRILQRTAQSTEDGSGEPQPEAGEKLALRIRKRDVALDDAQALGQIESALRQSLQINNPKWLGN